MDRNELLKDSEKKKLTVHFYLEQCQHLIEKRILYAEHWITSIYVCCYVYIYGIM